MTVLRNKFRYITYAFTLLMMLYETASRFGPPIAVIGGMVKKDCTDPLDEGKFCWSEKVQALVIGCFYYGYTLQFLVAHLATRYGFTLVLRIGLLVSALSTGFYPQLAALSPYAIITTQIVRGFFAGIVVPYQFAFISKWSLPSESKYLISFTGAIIPIGTGLGSLLAGLTATSIGWEYYFYICGALFLISLLANIICIPDVPQQCRFMSESELSLYPEESRVKKDSSEEYASWTLIAKRYYVWAFSFAHISYNFVNYNLFNCVPFYLDEVYKLSTEILSWSTMIFGFIIGFSMIILSKIFQTVDKKLSWIKSRMFFTLAPMFVEVATFLIIPNVNSVLIFIILVSVQAFGLGPLCSGSYMTANYDMDPQNSARIVSIINSFAQLPGFLGPLFMVFMTETDPATPNYDRVLRSRWDNYFYVLTAAPVLQITVIVGSYLLRPNEWKLHPSLDRSEIAVNPAVATDYPDNGEGAKVEG